MKNRDVVIRKLSIGFGNYATWLHNHQRTVIVVTLIVYAILTAGCALLKFEDDTEYLFTPVGSTASIDETYYQNLFVVNKTRFALFQVSAKEESGNIWDSNALTHILRLHNKVLGLELKGTSSQPLVYSDICQPRPEGGCAINSPMRCFNFELSIDSNSGDIMTPNITFPRCTTTRNNTVYIRPLLDGVNTVPDADGNGMVNHAEIMVTQYATVANTNKEIENSKQFEEQFLKLVQRVAGEWENDASNPLVLTYLAARSFDDELGKSQFSDVPLIAVSFVLLSTFAIVINHSFSKRSLAESRHKAAQSGVWSALLSVGPAFGIGGYFGIPFVALNGVIPFLAVGIGVDDMFVLVASFNRQSPQLSVCDRLRLGLQESGVAITITTLTDLVAFLIGISSPFRAVKYFCAYCALAIVCDYLLQLTIFLVILSWEASRQAKQKETSISCGCFNRHKKTIENQNDHKTESLNDDEQSSPVSKHSTEKTMDNSIAISSTLNHFEKALRNIDVTQCILDALTDLPAHDYVGRAQEQFVSRRIGPFMSKPVVAVVGVLFFCAYITVGIIGTLSLTQGLELSQLAPDDSYLGKYEDYRREYFSSSIGTNVAIVIDAHGESFAKVDLRDSVVQVANYVVTHSDDVDHRDSSWTEAFETLRQEWNSNHSSIISRDMNGTEYRQLLLLLLEHPQYGPQFRGDLAIESPPDSKNNRRMYPANDFMSPIKALRANQDVRVRACIVNIWTVPLYGDTTRQGSAMKSMREQLANGVDRIYPLQTQNVFVFTSDFIFWEQFVVILPATIQSLGTAVAAMMVVALFFLPSFIAALITALSLVSIDVGVIGLMHFWGLSLNSITMVCLVMSIGFSVDVAAHMCHGFLHAQGYPKSKQLKLLSISHCKYELEKNNSIIHAQNTKLNERNVDSDLEEHSSHSTTEIEDSEQTALLDMRIDESIASIIRNTNPGDKTDYSGVEGWCTGKSRILRMTQSITHMGRPVLSGSLTTILAMLILAASSSYIFRAFFRMLFLVLVLAAVHGFFFIPLFMRLLGPARINATVLHGTSSSQSDNTENTGCETESSSKSCPHESSVHVSDT